MTGLAGELQVVRRPVVAEHDAVEPVVVPELGQNFEPEPVAVERDDRGDVVARPGDAEVGGGKGGGVIHRSRSAEQNPSGRRLGRRFVTR